MENENETNDERATTVPRRKLNTALLRSKAAALSRLQEGVSVSQIARDFNVSRSTVRDWRKRSDHIFAQTHKADRRRTVGCFAHVLFLSMQISTMSQIGGGRKPLLPQLDAHLLSYFTQQRQQNYAVSYKKIKAEIERVREEMQLPTTFKASVKFIHCWSRRHNIASYRATHVAQVDKRSHNELRAVI